MTTEDPRTAAALIVAGLKKAGIDFVATLPDARMLEVIRAVEKDRELKHVPLCREGKGIGICAGISKLAIRYLIVIAAPDRERPHNLNT